MRLTVVGRENLRQAVKNIFVKNPNSTKSDIVKHFVKQGYARSTIFKTINRLSTSSSTKNKTRTGRPSLWTATKRKVLKRLTNNRKGVSQRKIARKFDVTQANISKQLSKMKIECRKREKTPKYTEKQQENARENWSTETASSTERIQSS
jgi:arginine repressor